MSRLKTGRSAPIKSSLLPLLILLLPPALLFPEPVLRISWFALFTLYVTGRLYSGHIRKNLSAEREIQADSLFYGEEGYITLTVRNNSFLPALNILLSDRPDFQLNFYGRQRFLLNLKGRSSTTVRYPIKGSSRGQYVLRNRTVEASDFFGQFPWVDVYPDEQIITVYPRIFPVTGFYKTYRQPFGSIRNRYPIFEEITKLDGIRPFQSGDDRKKINWKQSARFGELLVNQYTPSISQKTLILLNQYSGDYDFRYREFYTELALEIAVSAAGHLTELSQEIGIQGSAEMRERKAVNGQIVEERQIDRFRLPPASGHRELQAILNLLAGIHPQDETLFLEELNPEILRLEHNACLLIISPDLDADACARVGSLRQQGLDPAVFLFGPSLRRDYGLKKFHIPLFHIKREEGMLRLEALDE